MSFVKVISSIFAQLAAGTPIYKISAPVFIHQPKSGLEMWAEDQTFSNGPSLLSLESIQETSDPVERIARLLIGLFNVHMEKKSDKPFNPILGEFLEETCEVDGKVFTYQTEQISHHPPVSCFRIVGPSFTLEPDKGLDGSKGFRPGFNHVEINFAESGILVVLKSNKTGKPVLTYTPPGVKIDPIFTGKRTTGYYGEMTVTDVESGLKFVGKIKKPLIFKGDLVDKDGKVIDSVEGDFFNGVFLKSTGKLWAKSADHVPVSRLVSDSVASDPLFSRNIWSKVFEAMRLDPPDFNVAEKEKTIVEERQRAAAKESKWKPAFISRYGFISPYATGAEEGEGKDQTSS